jgi:serine protease Do
MPSLPPTRSTLTRFSRKTLIAALLAGTMLGGTAGPLIVQATAQDAQAGAIQPIPPSGRLPDFKQLVQQVSPAVVSVEVKLAAQPAADSDDDGDQRMPHGMPFPFPFPGEPHRGGPSQGGEARGSGFFVDADGTIVTNNHVVENARSISVTLTDGTKLAATVIGRDPGTDLAVLRVKADHKFPFLNLGDSDQVAPGEWVLAIGNPFGLSGTVTAGIVSARGRDIGDGPYNANFIQVDAPINRGNSGGPLLTQDGKVVGVNSAIISPSGGSVGIGFAIPSGTVKTVLEQIEKSGHVTRGFIGVEVQPVGATMAAAMHLPKSSDVAQTASGYGALIAGVNSGSPAEQAGLQPGDIVLSVNGKPVRDPRALAQAIAAVTPGSHASLDVVRDGAARTVEVTVGTLPAARADASAGPSSGQPSLGLALAPMTPENRDRFNIPDDTRGVVIAEVQTGSPAEQAGLRAGDVVLSIGGKPVTEPKAAVAALRAATSDGKPVALRVLHEGKPAFIALNPKGQTQDDG